MQSESETQLETAASGAATHVWLMHANPVSHAFSDALTPTELQSPAEVQQSAGLGRVQAPLKRRSVTAAPIHPPARIRSITVHVFSMATLSTASPDGCASTR